MSWSPEIENGFEKLTEKAPADYFHGRRAANVCRPDNVIAFLRSDAEALKERTFESRPHHRHVLILNLRTGGSLSVDGAVYRLEPGEAFLVAPYQFHFYLDTDQRDIRWLFITFETKDTAELLPVTNRPIRFDESLAQTALSIAQGFYHPDESSEQSSNQIVIETTSLLARLSSLAAEQAQLFSQTDDSRRDHVIIRKVNRLLHERLSVGIDVVEIAARLNLSERYLRKRFQTMTGLSLGSYIMHYRLDRAVKRLVHSDASLTEIADDCGYGSLAAFSRTFTAKMGVTPSQYRKQSAK